MIEACEAARRTADFYKNNNDFNDVIIDAEKAIIKAADNGESQMLYTVKENFFAGFKAFLESNAYVVERQLSNGRDGMEHMIIKWGICVND